MKEEPIRFGALKDAGLTQPDMLGVFARGQLIAARLADDSRRWKIEPGETCAEIERKIVDDLRDMIVGAQDAAE